MDDPKQKYWKLFRPTKSKDMPGARYALAHLDQEQNILFYNVDEWPHLTPLQQQQVLRCESTLVSYAV